MDVTCTVNLNGIEEKLNEIGPQLAKKYLRKAMKAGMQLIVDDAKAHVPVDTGALRDSIVSVATLSAKQDSGRCAVGPSQDPGVKKSGQDFDQSPALYGMLIEFGVPSRHIERVPWLRPAFDAQADNVVVKFVEVLAEGLAEVTK